MASTSLTFRCPDEVLEAIDNLGKERYPAANTKHGCDRSKTLIDIMRAGIEALSDGSVVLPAPAFVRQQSSYVRQDLSDNLEQRIAEIIEPLQAELKAEIKAELLGESAAARQDSEIASITQQLAQTQAQLAAAQQEMTESTKNSKRFSGTQSDLIRTANEKIIVDQQLEEVTRDRDELKQQVETLTASRQQLQAELDRTREELAKLKENPPTDNTQQPAVELKLPSPADLLNQLKKANGKKFTASLTDVEKILESLGGEES
jgi:chromosome segregation ATPase